MTAGERKPRSETFRETQRASSLKDINHFFRLSLFYNKVSMFHSQIV